MTLQLSCLALIAVLVIVRGRGAVTRPEARLTWVACIAGALSLTMYGFPAFAERVDQLLGGQNLLTLIRDLSVVLAVWCFRRTLNGRTTARTVRATLRLLAVVLLLVTLFLLIGHRSPTAWTLVLNQIHQPAAWLYGCTYMAAVLWILLDAARLLLHRGAGNRWMTVIALGAATTALGCAIEVVVFTTAHFSWGGATAGHLLANAFVLPFFGGLATMLLGVAALTVLGPARRRIVILRLQLLSYQRRLTPVTRRALLALFADDKYAAGHTHHLLVVLGNAQRAGAFTPTAREAALVEDARDLLRADHHFQPVVLRRAV